MFPKPKRIKDKKAIEDARKPFCEVCGETSYGDPHHVVPRSVGGPDIRYNLLQLCAFCHYGAIPSGKLTQEKCFARIARREGAPAEKIKAEVNKKRGRG